MLIHGIDFGWTNQRVIAAKYCHHQRPQGPCYKDAHLWLLRIDGTQVAYCLDHLAEHASIMNAARLYRLSMNEWQWH